MQKRLLSMLMIGGVAVFSFATNVVQAEDGVTPLQSPIHSRILSNINDVEKNVEPAATTPASIAPELQRPEAPRPANDSMPEHYRPLVESISRNNSVDPNLIDAMIRTESNYNPWAISSKGARGLMQLIPETGRRFGVQDFFDPKQNIEGGVRYVRYLLDMFQGDVDLSLAAYNAGENLVARLGAIPPIPETRNYVQKIRAVYAKSWAGSVESNMNSPVKSPSPAAAFAGEKAQEPANAPISDTLDERGVHHFSNIGPR